MSREAAQDALRRAQEHHALGQIDQALSLAREAVALDASYLEAWSYLGTTLVTRRLEYAQGLEALETAQALAPEDAGIQYSLGWCYEFVAYRLDRQASKPYRSPAELFTLAAHHLCRCIELRPEQGLKEDAEDLLQSIEDRFGPQ